MAYAVPVIRALQPDDLKGLPALWGASPWSATADELQEIASGAAADATEHRGLCSVQGNDIDGVVLFRMVAGTVGTGEIECAVAREFSLAAILTAIAMSKLRDEGARLIVAEYPGTSEYSQYAQLLSGAGLREQASIADYFADGVPLVIATRQLR